MSTDTETLKTVAEYEARFRHPDREKLEMSGLYDLFPTADAGGDVRGRWPEPWLHGPRAGVYLIFDAQRRLLYVGKASLRSSLGGRLYDYFREDQSRSCVIRHAGWSSLPRYVLTIAVPKSMNFEAPALEEYLITKLQPPDNKLGLGHE